MNQTTAENTNDLGSEIDFGFDSKAFHELMVKSHNDSMGTDRDGYNCDKCKNRGDYAVLKEKDGRYSHELITCECQKIRKSLRRIEKSGMGKVAKEYTLEAYIDTESWQKTLKRTVESYMAAFTDLNKLPAAWLYLGGNNGAGKTHLCTAAAVSLIMMGLRGRYMLWQDDSKRLKAVITDAEEYSGMIEPLKTCDLLYIDDLFKVKNAEKFNPAKVSDGDCNLAFEILNYRYCAKLPTIISSERYIDELISVDQAIGGRIAERSFNLGFGAEVKRDVSRDYRLRNIIKK